MEENSCLFVSSRGIMKSCNIYNKSSNSDETDISYLNEMIKNQDKLLFNGVAIYVCSNQLTFFVENILPKLKYKFLLYSGDSIKTVPSEVLSQELFVKLITDEKLLLWFSQNNTVYDYPKIIQLPLGLDYHTIFNNPIHKWKKENEPTLPVQQEKILLDIIRTMKPFKERKVKMYVDFTTENDRFGERKDAFKEIPKELMVISKGFKKRTDNWKEITNFCFVLSPSGFGYDCHRTWEAICLGATPVIKTKHFKKMFEFLPVLVVDNWIDITQKLLNDTFNKYNTTNYDYNKLKLKFWTQNMIK